MPGGCGNELLSLRQNRGAANTFWSGAAKSLSFGRYLWRGVAEQLGASVVSCPMKTPWVVMCLCIVGLALGEGEPQSDNRGLSFDEAKAKAERGDATNQFVLAIYHAAGAEKNSVEAVKWFRKAAEQGHVKAQYHLATCYQMGEGIGKDRTEAVKWFRKAAENNHAEAQGHLGTCYYMGDGVEKDYPQAIGWFRKGAEQGSGWAASGLAVCYYDGQGVAKDLVNAAKWFRKAADLGDPRGLYSLGNCYYFGEGVEKDYTEAYAWWNVAAARGDELAAKRRDQLEIKLALQQVAEAQKRSKELREQIESRFQAKIKAEVNAERESDEPKR